MNATSMRPRTRSRAAIPTAARQLAWGAIATWLLCFFLVAYLGYEGGGYDPLVSDRVAIAVWWVVLAGVAVGAFPRQRLGRLAWVALALLAVFVAWTALSLSWTESVEKTFADLARTSGYLGIFALALLTRARGEARRLVGAVAAGATLVAMLALLSRLHPAWFPEATQTASLVDSSRERLSYPINYWNGLGALVAIALPLVLQCATDARSLALRGLAAAALPALALTAFFTLSRGGIAAAAIAVALYLGFSSDRLPKALTALVAALGSAVLVAAASQRDALQHGFTNATARSQGDELLLIVVVVCLLVGLVQAGISYGLLRGRRPAWTRVSRRQSLIALGCAVLVFLVAAAALDVPGRVSGGWAEFKRGGEPGHGTARLGSVAGQSRYQLWKAALNENSTKPLTGTGSGTFELWWARHNTTGESVRDTHSLYLQTLGELGLVGLAILLAFMVAVFAGGGRAVLRAPAAERAALAAALAGCAAFFLTAAVDWMWQIPVLPVAMLLLAAALLAAVAPPGKRRAFSVPWRVATAVAALAAIVAIAIPFASTASLRSSEAEVRSRDLGAALTDARTAANVEPGAAGPRLQQALVYELRGQLAAAAAAATTATEKEATNWRNWLVLSRIEAERGNPAASVDAYRRARTLNPTSPLFER